MILVTGATGTTGSEVVRQLAERGASVRAFVRSADKAAAIQDVAGEIAVGDMAAPETLDAAMVGVERVFLLSPVDPRQVELQGNVIAAAERAGVEHVVKMAALGTSAESPITIARMHAETEARLEASGMAFTHLHPHLFMQSFLGYAPTIKSDGAFYAPMKDGALSMVDARDIAAVAAAALTEEGHAGRVYDITGPEALSFADAAAKLSTAIGKPVRYVDVPPAAAREAMLGSGMPEWLVDDLLRLMDVFSAGLAAEVTTAVADVAKVEPRTFDRFVRDHARFFLE